MNVVIDSGADGGILDTETAECYEFDCMSSRKIKIVTVIGTERREFERNAIPMRTVDGSLVNAEAIQIKNIGHIRKLNKEFTLSNKANMKTRRFTCY